MRRIPHLILILCAACLPAFSQVEIPVDMYTGQPSISVPIWNITSGDVSQPIVLSYSANTATQQHSMFGPGWNIATGSISREVRTYPDDVGYMLPTKGWLYKKNTSDTYTNAATIGNYTPSTDENTNYVKLEGFGYAVDTEPDIFSYTAGGFSGSFVFDNSGNLRTIPYADVAITPTYTSTDDKRITSFTITTNNGFVYTFGHILSATRSATQGIYTYKNYYLPTEYEMYNPSVTYTQEWRLTRIDSPNGAYITFTYSNSSETNISDAQLGLYQYPDSFISNSSDILQYTIYRISQTSPRAVITAITGSTGAKAEFSYSDVLQSITITDERRGTTTAEKKVKTFSFNYTPVINPSKYNHDLDQTVQFLSSITESSGCEILPPYKFRYGGFYVVETAYYNRGSFLESPTGSDLWGFPTQAENAHPFPKLYIYPSEPMVNRYRARPIPGYPDTSYYTVPGANRYSSANVPGILIDITSPEGGVTEFEFESNKYLDTRTNVIENAGGLRIKKISYYDGFNQNPIVKTFEYVDPDTGLSSGRLIRMPALAAPSITWKSPSGASHDKTYSNLSTNEQKYQYLLIRREGDLTQGETTHGNTVGYKIVTVKRPGAGYVRFEFLLPAVYGDTAVGDWAPTVNKFARSIAGSSVNMGIVDGTNTWGFPFTPNSNYDFERGLIWKKSDYTADDKMVQQTITTYQRLYKSGSAPAQIGALKYDRYPGCNPSDKIFFYGKYFLLTDVVNVPAKEVTTTWDLADGTGANRQKDSIEYVYGSLYHKLLTQIKRYTSDGNLYTTHITYPKDYTANATSGANDAVAVNTMKTNNRHAMPIETIQTFKRPGNDSVWVVSGSVVRLDAFGGSKPMVRSVWQLKISPPIYYNSFYQSNIISSSGYKFKIDSRYEKMDSILSYNSLGNVTAHYNPVSRKTTVTGYGYSSSIPVVQLENTELSTATDIQAGFSDFETTTDYEFTAATSYFGTGRTGLKAFYPKELLYKVVSRAPNVSNYILGFWVKSNTTFTLSVSLRPAAGGTAYSTVSVNIPNTSSEFKYIQRVIPLTGVPGSGTFRVDLQASSLPAPPTNNPAAGGTSASLLNVIDDVFFYPENADMTATTYQIPYGATAVTSGNGVTMHTEYDKLGRMKIIYDQNKNIVKRNVYQYTAQSPLSSDFSITGFTAEVVSTFKAPMSDCVTDATYEWDLGSGFVSGSSVLTHTYSSIGKYTVSLRVTSPTYGVKTTTKTFYIVTTPFTIDICAKGVVYYYNNVPDAIATDCSAVTGSAPGNGVIFGVSVGSGSLTYQWQLRTVTSSTWVNVGGNSRTYSPSTVHGGEVPTTSYEVRCIVTKAGFGTGISPVYPVTYEYSY